jgi:hypothetical protein
MGKTVKIRGEAFQITRTADEIVSVEAIRRPRTGGSLLGRFGSLQRAGCIMVHDPDAGPDDATVCEDTGDCGGACVARRRLVERTPRVEVWQIWCECRGKNMPRV